MNSPWGNRAEIIKYFGWTYDYLLWGITWLNVQLMLADGARYVTADEGEESSDGKPVVHRELKTKKEILDYINGVI
jgi:hypothetical protein